MGHGDPKYLGPGAASISTDNVENYLQNNQKNPLVATNRHAFRFVFLDGCDGSEGNWPQTFGIPKQKHMQVRDFVNKRGLRPRAFVGWDRSKLTHNGIIAGAQLYPPHVQFITTFWEFWSQSTDPNTRQPPTVAAAIDAATKAAPLAALGIQVYGADDLAFPY